VRSGSTWSQQAYLKASQVTTLDNFGWSVDVSEDTVVVGARYEDSSTTGINSTPNDSADSAGAAYVFVRSGSTWSQQAYLKPNAVGTTQAGDQFGWAVAVSGDTVVVGADFEDSSTTGINSTSNEALGATGNAGAAYVFVRSSGTWSQQAYLKPNAVGTTQAGDQFGHSVDVSGDTVVVGGVFEDSSTTGINSTPNETAGGAGAAYVFVRSGSTWSQQAYLKASQVTAADQFGRSVAVSGDTVLVGANREGSSTTGVNSTPNESAGSAGAAYVFTGLGVATVTTPTSDSIAATSATLGGNVTSDGGATITARGIVYAQTATNNNPQIGGTGVTNVVGSGTTGVFTVTASGLTAATTYTYAAYVTTSAGTIYSSPVTFTTVNVAPTLAAIAVSGTEDTTLTFTGSNFTGAYTDPESTPLASITVTTLPATGLLKLSGTNVTASQVITEANLANLTYVPAVNENGAKTFTVTASDGMLSSAAATVTMTLAAVNDAPTLTSIANQTTMSGTATAALAFTVGDAETAPGSLGLSATSNNLAFVPDANIAFGGSGAARTVTVTPVAGQSGTVTITLTASDGSLTGNTSFNVSFDNMAFWAQTYFGSATVNVGNDEDFDSDGVSNLLEFAFGTLPNNNASGSASLQYTGTFAGGGTLTSTGQPRTGFEPTSMGIDFRALFVRRNDYAASGLTYTPQFSANLTTWQDSATVPTVLADNGTHQVVSVPYPPFIGGKKARFFRINVTKAQ
jgi:hypothetical protein